MQPDGRGARVRDLPAADMRRESRKSQSLAKDKGQRVKVLQGTAHQAKTYFAVRRGGCGDAALDVGKNLIQVKEKLYLCSICLSCLPGSWLHAHAQRPRQALDHALHTAAAAICTTNDGDKNIQATISSDSMTSSYTGWLRPLPGDEI